MANAIDDVEAVKQTINDALETISEKAGFGPREQYKALRGLAFQAFGQLIEAGEFKQLVKDAQLNAKHLPRGWGMVSQADREEAAEEVTEAPVKKTAAKKAPAKKSTRAAVLEDEVVEEAPKRTARRRPARKSAE